MKTPASSILYEGNPSKARSLKTLFIGLLVGFCMAQFISYITLSEDIASINTLPNNERPMHQPTNNVGIPNLDVIEHEHPHDNTSLADQLKREVRVLCWIMTNPSNHKTIAVHVKRTWGKRCNKLIFMSSAKDEELDSVALPIGEGRNYLWGKTKEAFKYIYERHINDADWFLKADDDTYTIVENLRYMLYPYSPETPVYFGCKLKPYVKQGFMSGGAGYVLSREAVRRFVVEALPDHKLCQQDNSGAEDVELGKCLENLNVTAGDSRDVNGRGRMFPLRPEKILIPDKSPNFWYWSYIYYKTDDGLNCCSDNAISFHYVPPNVMYALDYLIYHLKPFGVLRREPLPGKLKVGEFMPPPKEKPANSIEDSVDDYDRLYTTKQPIEPDSIEVH